MKYISLRNIALDALLWFAALPLAKLLRVDFALENFYIANTNGISTFFAVFAAMLLSGYLIGIYSRRNRIYPGTRTEDIGLALTHLLAGLVGVVYISQAGIEAGIPRSVPLIAASLVLPTSILSRSVFRWLQAFHNRSDTARLAIVIGAGERAVHFVRSYADPDLRVVGVLSGEMDRVGALIHGIRVKLLSRNALIEAITKHNIDTFIVISDLPQLHENYSEVFEVAKANSIQVLTWPSHESLEPYKPKKGRLKPSFDLQDLDPMTLIGRDPVELDKGAVSKLIENRTVLVTGAGGSIGSEICRQVQKFNPSALYLLDRDESGMHATELSLHNSGLLDTNDIVLADIRDHQALDELFQQIKPDIVFHAAALKHYPILQRFPFEAFKTNVVGTYNVLCGAAKAGATTFVNVSTDKAANPSTVLGYSKRAAERITAGFVDKFPGVCVSVRFGNVFGSRGSVITTFQDQIRKGGPLTVTDRDVERYFMSIPEASLLVLEAAAFGTSGQTMVLEMGKPVRINDIAEKLLRLSGDQSAKIVYTGLRPGEKLSEDLVDETETPTRLETTDSIIAVKIDPIAFSSTVISSIGNPKQAEDWLEMYGASQLQDQTLEHVDQE